MTLRVQKEARAVAARAEEKRKSAEEARDRVEKDTVEKRKEGDRFIGVRKGRTGEEWNEAIARVQAGSRGRPAKGIKGRLFKGIKGLLTKSIKAQRY